MIRSADERHPGCGWRRVRPRADGRSGTPESRSQLEELRSGEWVTEPGRPGAYTTTDFLWDVSSNFFLRVPQRLARHRREVVRLVVCDLALPHDEDDLQPLGSERLQGVSMTVSPGPPPLV